MDENNMLCAAGCVTRTYLEMYSDFTVREELGIVAVRPDFDRIVAGLRLEFGAISTVTYSDVATEFRL